MKKIFLIILVSSISVLGLKLRLNNSSSVPLPGQSLDEYSNAWVGMSLIRLGLPVGISGLSGYQNQDKRYINVDHVFQNTAEGQPLAISYPWFDHPPMMGIVTGGFAYIRGARIFEDATVSIIRKPMIIIGTLSVALVYLLAAEEFGVIAGLISSLIYAISPLVIIASRMGQAENGFIPLFLLSIYCLEKYLHKNRRAWLWASAVIGGFGILFKISAISIVLTGILLLITTAKNKREKFNDLLVFVIPAISFLMLFIAFGMSIDPRTFWAIFASNAGRIYGIGFNSISELITQSKLTGTKFVTDPWVLFGWVSFIYLLTKKQGSAIKAAIISYLVIYIFFGSESYGWYRFPFLPFLAIASGYLISNLKELELCLPIGFSLLMVIGTLLSKLSSIENNLTLALWTKGSVLGLVILTWCYIGNYKNTKLTLAVKMVLAMLFVLAVILTIFYNNLFNIDYWYKAS